MGIISCLFGREKRGKNLLKEKILKERKKTVKDLKQANHSIKLLIEKGEIEVKIINGNHKK